MRTLKMTAKCFLMCTFNNFKYLEYNAYLQYDCEVFFNESTHLLCWYLPLRANRYSVFQPVLTYERLLETHHE